MGWISFLLFFIVVVITMQLFIPALFYSYTFIAIDPGSNYTGVAIYRVRASDGFIESIDPIEVLLNVNDPIRGIQMDQFMDVELRLMRWGYLFERFLHYYNPVMIAYETPFFNPRTPASYRALTEQLAITKRILYGFNPNIPLFGLSPKEVKAPLVSASTKGKQVILDNLLTKPEVVNAISVPLTELSEDAIDAVAVGYSLYKRRY